MDDAAVKIITALGVNIAPLMESTKMVEAEFARLSAIAKSTQLVLPGATTSASDVVKPMTAQAAMVQTILKEGEVKKQAIVSESAAKTAKLEAEAEYKRTATMEKESKARINTARVEAEQTKTLIQAGKLEGVEIANKNMLASNAAAQAQRNEKSLADLRTVEARKQAIVAESQAKINAIQSRADISGAKADAITNVADSKVAVQAAREQAILQESEAKKVTTVAKGEAEVSAIRAKEALTQQATVQKQAATELAIVKNQVEQQKLLYMQARKAAFEDQPSGVGGLLLRHMSWFATGAVLFEGFDLLKESLVDVEVGMKGLSTVLPEIAHDQEAYNDAAEDTINLMQKLGSDLDETMASARSFGRMYKDVETVMGLTNDAILLNVIDQVDLENAVKGNEAALSTYGDTLKSTNEVLAFSGHLMDSITNLSHNTLATGTDLVSILQQTSSAAKQADTDLDQLLGTGAAAIRATGLQGQGGNIGRMLRTVFTQLSAPSKDVEETIEGIGVQMRNLDTGELRSAYDIILDLSLATKDASLSQEELNDAILKAASGKFQYNKLSALVGQFDDIIKNTAMSINSQGKTLEMAGQQLDTISRKAGMLRATFIDLFSEAGDSGLREAIKDIIDALNQFIMGLKNISTTGIKTALGLGALLIVGKSVVAIYTAMRPAIALCSGAMAAQTAISMALTAGEITATAATAALNTSMTALAVRTAFATAGISVLLGALAIYVSKMGEAEKSQMDFNQTQEDSLVATQQQINQHNQEIDFLESMAKKRQELTDSINSGKLSEQELTEAKKSLQSIDEAVMLCIDDETRKQMEQNGIRDDEIGKIADLINARNNEAINMVKVQISMTEEAIRRSQDRLEVIQWEMEALQGLADAYGAKIDKSNPAEKFGTWASDKLNAYFGGDDNTAAWHLKNEALAKEAEAIQSRVDAAAKRVAESKSALTTLLGDLGGVKVPGDDSPPAGSGGSGSKSSDDWLTAFLKNTLSAAEAQDKLNASSERAIDLENAKIDLMADSAMSIEEFTQGMGKQTAMEAMLEEQQKGLNKEADLYRKAITLLEDKQKTLDTSTEDGAEAYSKISDEIENCRQKVDDLTKSNIELEKQQRETYGGVVNDVLNMMDKVGGLGIDTDKWVLDYIEGLDYTKLTLPEIIDLMTKYRDLTIEMAEAQIDANLEAQKAASDVRIAGIQAEIDALREQKEAEEELKQEEEARKNIAEAELSLAEAQKKLENVEKEKNVRILKDGVWSYIADPKAIDDAQDAVDDANQQLADAQEALTDLMEQQAEQQLQDQMDAEKKKQEEAEKAAEQQKKDLKKSGGENNELLKKTLDEAGITLDGGMQNMLDITAEKCQAMIDWLQRLIDKQAEAGLTPFDLTEEEGTGLVGSFDSGGPIPETGLALVHKGEHVLKKSTVDALGGANGIERMVLDYTSPVLRRISPPSSTHTSTSTSTSTSSTNVDQSVNLNGPISFPNVRDWKGMSRKLRSMAKVR